MLSLKRSLKVSSFLLLAFASVCSAELSRTYPTSPVTTVRMDAFMETFRVLVSTPLNHINVNRNWDITKSTSTEFVYISSRTDVHVWYAKYEVGLSTWVYRSDTWTLDEYADHVVFVTLLEYLNAVLDNVVEQFLVYPSTAAPNGWAGWCLKEINGNLVPIECETAGSSP